MKFLIYVFFIVTSKGQNSGNVEETTTDLCSNGTEESCEAFNSTELSTLPVEVTSAVSKKATTKKPKTATAKSVNKKTLPQNGSNVLQPQPECSCDLTRGGCEVNCCCDVDCSESQRAVFTQCAVLPTAVDTDHCVLPHVLYRNNTDYQTVLTDGGMLCVVKQNTHVTTDYRDVPVVESLTTLKRKLEKHKHYSWRKPQPVIPVFDPDMLYQEGSPVWISDNITISHLAFPSVGGYSTQCLSSLSVKYLVDTDTSCTVPLQNKAECLKSSYTNFTVISSPHYFNFTGPQECTDDICLPNRQFVCSKTCSEEKVPPPTIFNSSNNFCLNVVESFKYEVYHNGSQGIVEVKAFYTMGNFTVQQDQLIRRHYRVVYKWAGVNGEQVLKRSGHPGYERGRPIISGKKMGKTVVLNTSETEWISLAIAGPSGHCMNRHNLMFRESVKSQCIVKVSGTCKQIQQQLWQQMLGAGGNLSEMVISAFGDPRVGDVDAWVPLLYPKLPNFPSLITAADIVLLYTLVGSVSLPQAKIIGVFLDLHSEEICTSNLKEVMVTVSVKFLDKTVPPVTKFAPPPVYEIKLPEDFFYPFLSSVSRMCFVNKTFVIMSVLTQWLLRLAVLKFV